MLQQDEIPQILSLDHLAENKISERKPLPFAD
jgi:hypothetical protein